MNRKLLAVAAFAVAGLVAAPAAAQIVISGGERSSVFSCFYECEPGTRSDVWGEITVLVLESQNVDDDVAARVIFLDGNEQMIAQALVSVSKVDIDMINVCRTLEANGVAAPRAGVIEVLLRQAPGDPTDPDAVGVYGWVKNFVGKFFKVQDDPFSGRIEGVGKTECRITPSDVATVAQIQSRLDSGPTPPEISPIYVSDTAD